MDECQRSSCIARISAPFVRSVVANECLRVCADTSFTTQACRARLETMVVMKFLESRTSSSDMGRSPLGPSLTKGCATSKLCRMNRGQKASWRERRYSEIRPAARSVRYTTRTFPPFPRTANSSVSRLIRFLSKLVSSEMRSQVEYMHSRIARSRLSRMSDHPQVLNIRSISSGSKNVTCRSWRLASSTFVGSIDDSPRFLRNFKNERMVTM